ncbi:MAG: chain-length determining protein, partial [FCB group bacterium]|nr:chain-length determining protein [FCB group bacterium]
MQKPDYTEEISLLEMFDTLKSRRKFIFWFTGIITVIALVYALVATPMYSSYVSIYPSL